MNDNTLTPDRYAGDEAWQDWFDICSVGGCPAAHAARTAARGEEWDKGIYSRLDAATDAAELETRAAEIKRKVDQAVWSIKSRKGWK